MNKTTTIVLTKAEQNLLYEMVNSHIIWGEGGCLLKEKGDTSKVDNKKMKLAESILKKI